MNKELNENVQNTNDGTAREVTVVDSLGTSSTSAISQRAATAALFNDPANRSRIQLGNNSSSTGGNSLVVGDLATATADYSVAIGTRATSTGLNAVALGPYTNASGESSVAIGRSAECSEYKCTSIGYRSKVHAEDILTTDYRLGIISVGDSYIEDIKRIINVREGRNRHDAINLIQAYNFRSSTLNLINDLVEVLESVSMENIPSKLSSLKSKVKQEIEHIQQWEKEQQEYYTKIYKNAPENPENE